MIERMMFMKNIKHKLFTVLTIILIIISICSVGFCEAHSTFKNPVLIDNAGYLNENQYTEITEKLNVIRDIYNFDVAIYTDKKMQSSNAEAAADDIFDYNGYGYGADADGIILYISANPRKYHFSTHGKGEIFFNDNGLAYLEKKILPYLKSDDYYTALKTYVEESENLLKIATEGNPYNKKQLSTGYVCAVVGSALLLPLLIAYIMMKIKLSKMKTANQNDYAANYIKPGSKKLNFSRDIFLYSTLIKTEKPKPQSGGHVSSSGEHHGGRGGSF